MKPEPAANHHPKPFLRWAGSKRSSIPSLAAGVPPNFKTYFEPFVGSGALYFHLRPEQAYISDLNGDLINLYLRMRECPDELHERLIAIPREKDVFNNIRSQISMNLSPIDRAVYMLYLNRNCFNGLYRTNKSGHFNVPFASSRRGEYPSQNEFRVASSQLQSTTIACGDFETILLRNVRESDFVYLDPPYIKREGRIFNEYVRGHFSSIDIDRLSNLLETIDARNAFFLLSFIEDDIVSHLRERWGSKTYMVQKNISGFVGSRRRSPEVLIKNW